MTTNKDLSIQALLRRLDLPARGWTVVDHWEGDLCAVGIAGAKFLGRLVYVSTFDAAPGRFHYECEVSTGPEPENYETTTSGENVSFDELFGVMVDHLG